MFLRRGGNLPDSRGLTGPGFTVVVRLPGVCGEASMRQSCGVSSRSFLYTMWHCGNVPMISAWRYRHLP